MVCKTPAPLRSFAYLPCSREAEVEEFTQCRYRETEQRLGIPGKQLSLFTSWNLKPATVHLPAQSFLLMILMFPL